MEITRNSHQFSNPNSIRIRIFVHAIADRSIERRLIPETLVSFYGSHPAQSPDFCRQISEQAAARLKALLDERPGEVIHGGQVDVAARFVAPTLITAPRLDSRLMREEIFGPLLPVIKVRKCEVIYHINAPFDFHLSVHKLRSNHSLLYRSSEP